MIDELAVHNLAVIASARIEPAPGFTVITGETGTGKTVLLGALRLLLGGEGRPDLVGPFADEAAVEGRFLDGDGNEIVASRRLARHGRSRAYLDGAIASARALEERVGSLVEVIAQHDHLSVTRPAEVRRLVDSLLDEEGRRHRQAYAEAWQQWREAVAMRDRLGGDLPALAGELDLARFQAAEIAQAAFTPGEDEELERRGRRLRHAAEIAQHLAEAERALTVAREGVGEVVAALRRAMRLDSSLEALAEEAAVAAVSAEELALDLRAAIDETDPDPKALEEVESRLTLLGGLRRKYGRTLDDVLAYGESVARRVAELEEQLAGAEEVDARLEATASALSRHGRALAEARREAGERLTTLALAHLAELGLPDPRLEVRSTPIDPGPYGTAEQTLHFASDRRLRAGPVAEVASGGELSRLVLALRLAGGAGEAATLVFDEVDAGVGGATALALGRKLARLAVDQQVLCVTHLPQVAAFADRHYLARRVGDEAEVVAVEGEERREELARMLAGLPDSDSGRLAAGELLELAERDSQGFRRLP